MKLNLPKILSDVKLSTSKHAPQILVGLGVAGSIAATVFAIKATPKAIKLVEERKEKENKEHLTPLETIETTWKCYVPSAVILLTSAACTIGSCSMSTKRYAALTAAYKIAETTYNDYHEKGQVHWAFDYLLASRFLCGGGFAVIFCSACGFFYMTASVRTVLGDIFGCSGHFLPSCQQRLYIRFASTPHTSVTSENTITILYSDQPQSSK